MLLRLARPRALRACAALAFVVVLLACGGGGGDAPSDLGLAPSPAPVGPPAAPPVQPPLNAPPPDVRGPVDFQSAHLVLGQEGFEADLPNAGGATTARTVYQPKGLAVTPDGHLLVADALNNRILLFGQVTQHGQAAVGLLGQERFEDSGPSGEPGRMARPRAIAVGYGKMAVADSLNNRVLIYNQVLEPGPPGQLLVPSVVIASGHFSYGFYEPSGVAITPLGHLIVSDSRHNRVLIWDPIPETQTEVGPPTRVLGQGDLAHVTENDDNQNHRPDVPCFTCLVLRATARTMSEPFGVWSDGRRLAVADSRNHRVLIWNEFPTDDFQRANVVLGHSDFENTNRNSEHDLDHWGDHPTAATLANPMGIHFDGTSFAVADSSNHRVLIWNGFPSQNLQPADVVLGHESPENGDYEIGSGPTSQVFNYPEGVVLTPEAVYVSDRFHNRVLVFRR